MAGSLRDWGASNNRYSTAADLLYRTVPHRNSRACNSVRSFLAEIQHRRPSAPWSNAGDVCTPASRTGDFSAVGSVVVATTSDLKYTINCLRNLEKLTDPKEMLKLAPGAKEVAADCVIHLRNQAPDSEKIASYEVPLSHIKAILSYLGFQNTPFDLMAGVLSLIQGLFYPTDDKIHDEGLAYYRQREWRLVSGMSARGGSHARILSPHERGLLLEIDADFWARELFDGKERFRRVEDTEVVDQFAGRPFADLISEVLVPRTVEREARELFGHKVTVTD